MKTLPSTNKHVRYFSRALKSSDIEGFETPHKQSNSEEKSHLNPAKSVEKSHVSPAKSTEKSHVSPAVSRQVAV